jgi:hypothetical protein
LIHVFIGILGTKYLVQDSADPTLLWHYKTAGKTGQNTSSAVSIHNVKEKICDLHQLIAGGFLALMVPRRIFCWIKVDLTTASRLAKALLRTAIQYSQGKSPVT